jgi:hypothetical protein
LRAQFKKSTQPDVGYRVGTKVRGLGLRLQVGKMFRGCPLGPACYEIALRETFGTRKMGERQDRKFERGNVRDNLYLRSNAACFQRVFPNCYIVSRKFGIVHWCGVEYCKNSSHNHIRICTAWHWSPWIYWAVGPILEYMQSHP